MGVGRTILLAAALASCRSHARGAVPAALDEIAVKKMTHALFDAYDRADDGTFADSVGAAFVSVDDGRARDRNDALGDLRARRERHPPSRTRTYKEERVWAGAESAVYFGETVEHLPNDGPMFTGDFDGLNTIVWAKEAGAWKAVSWQWMKSGLAVDRGEWNAMYIDSLAGRERTPSQPNKFLVEMVRERPSGTALDVAMGQGRNALYLAAHGWRVTGVDIADEGLRQAREAAALRNLRLETINSEVTAYDLGVEKWDLVTFVYAAGCPKPQSSACDATTVDKVRRALKPGGMVVVEGFPKQSVPWGFDSGELAALFKDGFTVMRDEVVDDVSDWGNSTPEKLVRFAAMKN
jgi:2-polyprenyl-3-methyl-5-hydroxy-6-metoxy-1,4-benzoquinol methylase